MPEDGKLVGRGSFKVDREKAAEKLSRYRLGDPAEFGLALVRSATLSGAEFMGWGVYGGEVDVDWDGRRLSKGFVDDPLGPLLGTRAEPAEAFLTAGLMGATQAGAADISLRTALGRKASSHLEWRSALDWSSSTGDLPPTRTTEVRFKLGRRARSAALAAVRRACRFSGLEIWIAAYPIAKASGLVDVSHGAAALRLRPRSGGGGSPLDLYVHGAAAGSVELEAALGPVEGALDCGALPLDASMGRVVKGDPLDKLLGDARGGMLRFAGILGEEQRREAKWVAHQISSDWPDVPWWSSPAPDEPQGLTSWLAWGSAYLKGYGRVYPRSGLGGISSDSGTQTRVSAAGARTRWLRRAAKGNPELGRVPLFLTWDRRWLSLVDLAKGGLMAAKKPPPGGGAGIIRLIAPGELEDLRALAPPGSVTVAG